MFICGTQIVVNQELDEPTAPQKSSGKPKKKKKKDDW
jgi:hypothetical protein